MTRIDPSRADDLARAFEARARRAEFLARSGDGARAPLRFVAGLLRAQGAVAAALATRLGSRSPLSVLESSDASLIESLLEVARHAERCGPSPLASEARTRAAEDAAAAAERLQRFRHGERGSDEIARLHDYLSRAMLRPLLELERALACGPARAGAAGRCPFCAGAPSIAFRRAAVEGDGAARHLVCATCGLDWTFQRIRCPACGEAGPDRLPMFHDERHAGVRLETCETCRRYVKSIDVSLDARAEPEVDDLASLALDLWGAERGLVRIEPGLAGV